MFVGNKKGKGMINLIDRIMDESENRELFENGEITAEERERRDEAVRAKCRAAIERDEAADTERIRQQLSDMGAEVDDRAARMVLWAMQSGKGFNYRKHDFSK